MILEDYGEGLAYECALNMIGIATQEFPRAELGQAQPGDVGEAAIVPIIRTY